MSVTITLTDQRAVDGWVEAANRAGVSPESMVLELVQEQGARYADIFNIGTLTSAAFARRFTAQEFGVILVASESSPQVAEIIQQLTNTPVLTLNDTRIASALALFESVGLLATGRAEEVMAWEHPVRN